MKEILLAFIFLISPFAVWAETIHLKSGAVVEGKIVERTDDAVKVNMGGDAVVTYYQDEIAGIEGEQPVDQPQAPEIPSGPGGEPQLGDDQAVEIINKTLAAYRAMHSFSCEGEAVFDIQMGGQADKTTTTFSMKLSKPFLYMVAWTSQSPSMKEPQRGAVWNAGDGAFLYQSYLNNYMQQASDEMALAGATGISGGIANTVPSLFFEGQNPIFKVLKNLKLKGTETFSGEECYVITGESPISPEMTLWISKDRFLLVGLRQTMGNLPPAASAPSMGGADSAIALKSMGMEATLENMNAMAQMMKMTEESLKSADFKGSQQEAYRNIQVDIQLTGGDLVYSLPEGVQRDDKIYEKLFKRMGSMMYTQKAVAGTQLTADAASALEEQLKAKPDDVETRMELIGYYFNKALGTADPKRQEHIVWLIENKPDLDYGETTSIYLSLDANVDGDAYTKAGDLWLKQVEKFSDNARVLRNAAYFFGRNDPVLSAELEGKAKALDPGHVSLQELYQQTNPPNVQPANP